MLEDITIIIPTFHRRGYLSECLSGTWANLPECRVIVVSDDGVISQTENEIYLPYDSGLAAKRNAGVAKVKTKYTLIGSDDFDFSTVEAREGVIKMEQTLSSPLTWDVDVVAGRVNNRPYEGHLLYVPGEYIKEYRFSTAVNFNLARVEIAANYFLARTEVLREIPWDESIRPIGGEHVDFFLDLKAAKKVVVYAAGVNIDQMPYYASKQDPEYRQLRRRALTTGHALMMKKRNIKKYYGFDEEVK